MIHWVDDMQCSVNEIVISFIEHSVTFHIDENHSASMDGSIKTAKALNQNCISVLIVRGDKVDVIYTYYKDHDKWYVHDFRRFPINFGKSKRSKS